MAASVEGTMQDYSQLSADDKKEVVLRITEDAFGIQQPDTSVTNNVWYIIVGTLAAIAILGLIAVVALVLKDKSTEVVAPFVTLAIGGLVGIVSPSPAQSTQ